MLKTLALIAAAAAIYPRTAQAQSEVESVLVDSFAVYVGFAVFFVFWRFCRDLPSLYPQRAAWAHYAIAWACSAGLAFMSSAILGNHAAWVAFVLLFGTLTHATHSGLVRSRAAGTRGLPVTAPAAARTAP